MDNKFYLFANKQRLLKLIRSKNKKIDNQLFINHRVIDFFNFVNLIDIVYLGTSQSSVSTPCVDFGWRNPIFKPSAPRRGALSIN